MSTPGNDPMLAELRELRRELMHVRQLTAEQNQMAARAPLITGAAVGRAVAVLRDDGLVVTVRGRGTFVVRREE